MDEILILGAVISAVVLGCVELVKYTNLVSKRFLPLVGIVIGLVAGYFSYSFTDLNVNMRLWAGLVAGLAATGFFELVKQNKKEIDK